MSGAATASPGEVITFYSYKGGTGRSMLLANVAWQLASSGRRVLVVDWDLEAPGLHRYFKPFLGGDPELREQGGVIDWVTDYWDAALEMPDANVDTLVRDYADPRHHVRRLDTEGYLFGGGIDLLGAGRQDTAYAEAVADFDWVRLYQRLRGAEFIDAAKRVLVGPGGYDYVLVDSRTGVSDTSGFCTVGLADTLVVCFTYNNQSVIGASQIARDIKRQAEQRRSVLPLPDAPRRFRLFAVPSRVDDLDPERLERRQKHAWALFADLLTDVPPDQQAAYWVSVQIRNQGLFAYEEVLAACMNRPTDPQSVLGAVNNLTRALTDGAYTEGVGLSDEQRHELRAQFSSLANEALKAPTPLDGWAAFVSRVPQAPAREAVLEACFPLLVQLYTPASETQPPGTEPAQALVRTTVLESELGAEERRMAESLTTVGLVHRRITDDRERGLSIVDDSILARWDSLRRRLFDQWAFLSAREHIRQARRGWELGGRSMAVLRTMQAEFATTVLNDDQSAWLGRPNLQFLAVLREVRTALTREGLLKVRSDNAEAELAAARAGWAARREDIEREHQARQETVEQRHRAWARQVTLVAGLAAVAVLLVGAAAWRLADERRTVLLRERDASERARAEVQARADELERSVAAQRAVLHYGEGARLLVLPSSSKDFDGAIDAFSKAIAADSGFAEAYRGRALARGRSEQRDLGAEAADWAAYYDLRPSLDGRSQMILRALDAPTVDPGLLGVQLQRLRDDAARPSSRDASPAVVAQRLELALPRFPAALRPEVSRVVEALRASQGQAAAAPTERAAEAPVEAPLTAAMPVAKALPRKPPAAAVGAAATAPAIARTSDADGPERTRSYRPGLGSAVPDEAPPVLPGAKAPPPLVAPQVRAGER